MHDSQQTCLVIAIRNSYPKLLAGGNISKIALKQDFRATIQAKSNWLGLLQHAGQTAMKLCNNRLDIDGKPVKNITPLAPSTRLVKVYKKDEKLTVNNN